MNNSFKDIGLIKLAKLLGQSRCMIVNPVQSPSSCVVSGFNFRDCLISAFSLICNDLVKFNEIRDAVKQQVHYAEQFKGTQWCRFAALNPVLKGHRPGELTILTGTTGCGKTTFLSEYSLDLCIASGVPTLWGSFEIHNHRLAKTMLIQFAGHKNRLIKNDAFDKFADAFSMLDMSGMGTYFMNFHGAEDMQRVNSAMAAAVVTHGIRHVILDNLQFMIGMEYSNADRFYKQDKVIHSLRRFCTVYNCHLTLVIHPRKETLGDNEKLNIQSIFGSAKASQEADNVLIIQNEMNVNSVKRLRNSFGSSNNQQNLVDHKSSKYLDIVKNRFDGDLAQIPLYFNKDSLSFVCGDIPYEDIVPAVER